MVLDTLEQQGVNIKSLAIESPERQGSFDPRTILSETYWNRIQEEFKDFCGKVGKTVHNKDGSFTINYHDEDVLKASAIVKILFPERTANFKIPAGVIDEIKKKPRDSRLERESELAVIGEGVQIDIEKSEKRLWESLLGINGWYTALPLGSSLKMAFPEIPFSSRINGQLKDREREAQKFVDNFKHRDSIFTNKNLDFLKFAAEFRILYSDFGTKIEMTQKDIDWIANYFKNQDDDKHPLFVLSDVFYASVVFADKVNVDSGGIHVIMPPQLSKNVAPLPEGRRF